jgi:hypothetical protein
MPEEVPYINFHEQNFAENYNNWLQYLATQAQNTGNFLNDMVQTGLAQRDQWLIDPAHDDFAGNGTNDAWLMAMAGARAAGYSEAQATAWFGTAENRTEAHRNNLDAFTDMYADQIDHNNANDFLNLFPDTDNDRDWYEHDRDSPSGDLALQLSANLNGMMGGIMETLSSGNLSPAISGVFIFAFHSTMQISIAVFDFIGNIVGNIASGIGNFCSGVANFFGWNNGPDDNDC